MASRRTPIVGLAIAGAVTALLATGYWATQEAPTTPNPEHVAAPAAPPQLQCVFIGYTGAPRVAFLFDMTRDGNEPRFEQTSLTEISGTGRTTKKPPFPDWRLDTSVEPARLESEITVIDNTAAGKHIEQIAIELYKYRPEGTNPGFIEAGLKNIHYQNLSGSCQQSRSLPLTVSSN